METSFIANREVRRIPRGWQHPKDAEGRYEPLFERAYCLRRLAELEPGEPGQVGAMPDVTGLATDETEIMAYETTSEGTPISPAFPDTPEGRVALVRYCAEHATTFGDFRADAEAWAGILFTDHVVLVDGKDGSIRIPLDGTYPPLEAGQRAGLPRCRSPAR
jgi:hypothetical protein